MDEYTPCKKSDPTAREAIENVMRLLRTQRRKPNKYNARQRCAGVRLTASVRRSGT